jgi:hypothetical protein
MVRSQRLASSLTHPVTARGQSAAFGAADRTWVRSRCEIASIPFSLVRNSSSAFLLVTFERRLRE